MKSKISWLRFEVTRFIPDVVGGLVVFAIMGSLFTVFWLANVPASAPTLITGRVEKTWPIFNEGPTGQAAIVTLGDGSSVTVGVAQSAMPIQPGDTVVLSRQRNLLGGEGLVLTGKVR